MTLLALIPARGGSKRLPRKNILPLAGKPMIRWTIEAAHEAANQIPGMRVVVSTEDSDIAEVCKPFCAVLERPPGLATDDAQTIDVVMHALDRMPAEHVVLLQPTSPLRWWSDISECVRLALTTGRPCVSVCERKLRPNGAVYVASAEHLRKERCFVRWAVPYGMPAYRSVDVDTVEDFRVCEQRRLEWLWEVA